MAKRFDVLMTRTTVETCSVTVEAASKERACLQAGALAPTAEWQPKSTSIDLDKVEWRETIGPEE